MDLIELMPPLLSCDFVTGQKVFARKDLYCKEKLLCKRSTPGRVLAQDVKDGVGRLSVLLGLNEEDWQIIDTIPESDLDHDPHKVDSGENQ